MTDLAGPHWVVRSYLGEDHFSGCRPVHTLLRERTEEDPTYRPVNLPEFLSNRLRAGMRDVPAARNLIADRINDLLSNELGPKLPRKQQREAW